MAVFVALGVVSAFVSPRAYAGQAAVLLLPLGKADPFVERMRGELGGLGFVVSETTLRRDEPLEEHGRAAGADAVVRTMASKQGVEVWINERASGRPMLRHLVVDERPQGPDVALVVLQTTELLRSELLAPAPSSPPVVVVAATTTPALPPERSGPGLSLRVGPGALWSPGGVAPLAAAFVRFGAALGPRTGVELIGGLPLEAALVSSATEGHADVHPYLAGGGVWFTLRRARWSPEAGLGWSLLALELDGTGTPPLVGKHQSLITTGAYARVGLGCALGRWVRVAIDVFGVAPLSRARIDFAGDSVATFGRFIAAGAAALELRWD